MVCYLSIGSDPTPFIEQLAKKLETAVKSISMGQGQEVHARKLLEGAISEGYFFIINTSIANTHPQYYYIEIPGIQGQDGGFF